MNNKCDEMILDIENWKENEQIWNTYGSELAGNFGMIQCGQPVVWGGKCSVHKKERRSGVKDRRNIHTTTPGNIWCWGCDLPKEEDQFAPSQLKKEKYHYCRHCMNFIKIHGHFPKTLQKAKPV